MGFIYESHGSIAIEGRRASFYIHSDYDWGLWHDVLYVHPEFLNEDVPDLITALMEYAETSGVKAAVEAKRRREAAALDARAAMGV